MSVGVANTASAGDGSRLCSGGGWWWCPADPKFILPDNTLMGDHAHQAGVGLAADLQEADHQSNDAPDEFDPEMVRDRVLKLLVRRGVRLHEDPEEMSGHDDTSADETGTDLGIRVDPACPDNDRFLLRIYFADGSFTTIAVDVDDEESAVRLVIASKIGLKDADNFCLAEVPDVRFSDVHELKPDDVPLTTLADKPLNWRGRLLLRRRVGAVTLDLLDPVSIRLSYMQAVQEFVLGEYPCSPKDAFKLASLQFRIVFGSFQPEKHIPGYLMGKVAQLLPAFLLAKYPEHEWATQILEGARRLSELEAQQLEELQCVDPDCTMDTMLMRMYLQQAHQITGRKVLLRIYLADGTFKTLPSGPHVRAHQICQQMGAKLSLDEQSVALFSLYEYSEDDRTRLMESESRLRIRVDEGQKVANGPRYVFRRPDLYSAIDSIVNDMAATHFSYIQAAAEYKSGIYKCRIPDVIFLSALHAMLENQGQQVEITDPHPILPRNMHHEQDVETWTKALNETVSGIGQIQESAGEVMFLRYIREQILQIGSSSGVVGLRTENDKLAEVIDSVPPIHPGPVFGW